VFFKEREVPLLSKNNIRNVALDRLLLYLETAIDANLKAKIPDGDRNTRL
jgi:hypothetical protein